MYSNPLGHEQITGMSTAKRFTSPIPAGAIFAVVTAEVQNVRYRDDGTDPTGSVGMLIKTTDPPITLEGDLKDYVFFEDASGAILNVAYYGA